MRQKETNHPIAKKNKKRLTQSSLEEIQSFRSSDVSGHLPADRNIWILAERTAALHLPASGFDSRSVTDLSPGQGETEPSETSALASLGLLDINLSLRLSKELI